MKKIYIIIILTVGLFGWEINTHRAFNQEALKHVPNLDKFVVNANVKDKIYTNEQFDDYDMTYFDYVTNGETNGISDKKWKQKFKKYDLRDLIEAGIILEDAQWPHWSIFELPYIEYVFDRGDGRFNNHFYDAQDKGNDLTYGIDVRNNALQKNRVRSLLFTQVMKVIAHADSFGHPAVFYSDSLPVVNL